MAKQKKKDQKPRNPPCTDPTASNSESLDEPHKGRKRNRRPKMVPFTTNFEEPSFEEQMKRSNERISDYLWAEFVAEYTEALKEGALNSMEEVLTKRGTAR